MGEETIQAGGVTMAWDPEARLLRQTYAADARPTGGDARRVQAWTEERVGRSQPFHALVDVGGAGIGATGWRFAWMTWAYRHGPRMRIAIFGAERVPGWIIAAFSATTRAHLGVFPNEAEARAWLSSSSGAEAI